MIKLTKLEIKKNIKKKSTLVTAGLALLVYLVIFIHAPFQEGCCSIGEELKGLAAVRMKKVHGKKLPKVLSESVVHNEVQQIKCLCSDKNNFVIEQNCLRHLKDKVYSEKIIPKGDLLCLLARNYSPINSDINAINMPDILNSHSLCKRKEAQFYSIRSVNVKEHLSRSALLNEKKRAYFNKKEKKLKTPFHFGYHLGWKVLIQMFPVALLFIILISCMFASSTFSSEYASKMDMLLLSSKLGGKKIAIAKILSIYLLVSLFYFIFWLVGILSLLIPYGFKGWNLPVQALGEITSFSYTLLQFVLLALLAGYLILIGLVTATLYLSTKFKTVIPVVIISVIYILISNFVLFNQRSEEIILESLRRLFSVIYIPHRDFCDYFAYSIGNLVFPTYLAVMLFYAILTCVLFKLSVQTFNKHQIG
ncbi:MAG: ABC transporter permease subunit [Lactobacillales bacterium]|jgi:hypothetical protein|nr:ABC transporter permease subunit [Lactobacillales bacterium]